MNKVFEFFGVTVVFCHILVWLVLVILNGYRLVKAPHAVSPNFTRIKQFGTCF